MSKLLKFKEWLTLEQAALRLANVIGEDVSIADLYHFALDGHLKLSVYFVNSAHAAKGKWLKEDDIDNTEIKAGVEMKQSRLNPQKAPKPNEMFVSKDDWIEWQSGIHPIKGIWDLTMQGQEALEVEDNYEKINSGLSVTGLSKNGILLQQGDVVCQLYKYFDREKIFSPDYNKSEKRLREIAEHPMRVLENSPEILSPLIRKSNLGIEFLPCNKLIEQGVVFVIKTTEVTRFIQSLEDTPASEKPLTTTERNSLLVLIGALCKEADIDPNKRGASVPLVTMTELIGTPLSGQTIRNVLKQIEAAISSKSK
jgi:hypothetical protein